MINQQPNFQVPVRSRVRAARIAMFVQAGLSIVMSVFLLALLSSVDGEGLGALTLLVVLGGVLGIVLLVCAVQLPRQTPALWWTVIGIEALNVLSAIIGVIGGALSDGAAPPVTAIFPLILSALVVQPLVRPEVRAAFGIGRR